MLSPEVWRLGWTLIHFAWEGLVVAAILAVVLRLLRRSTPEARYTAACGALLVLAVCPLATYLRFAVVQAARQEQFQAAIEAARARAVSIQIVEPRPSGVEAYLPLLVFLWACGVALLSVRMLGGILVVERIKRKHSEAAPEEWQERLVDLAKRLAIRRQVVLRQSTKLAAPIAMGVFRAFVVLPSSMLAHLTTAQIEAILLHELAHIRRQDYLVNLIQTLLETLLFYHPAVWWISRVVRDEREHCCDDMAVRALGDPVLYARTLTRLEEFRGALPKPSLSAKGGHLMNRIVRILSTRHTSTKVSPIWTAAAALVICASVLGGALEARAQTQTHTQRKTAGRSHRTVAKKPASKARKPVVATTGTRTKATEVRKTIIIVPPSGVSTTKTAAVLAARSAGMPKAAIAAIGSTGGPLAPSAGGGFGGGGFGGSAASTDFGGGGGFGGSAASTGMNVGHSGVSTPPNAEHDNGAISFDADGVSFAAAVRAVMKSANKSYVIGPDAFPLPINLDLKGVDLDTAVLAICFSEGATYRVRAGVYFFMMPLAGQDSKPAAGNQADASSDALTVHSLSIDANNTSAEQLFPMLEHAYGVQIKVLPGTYKTVTGKLNYVVLDGPAAKKENSALIGALIDACDKTDSTWTRKSNSNPLVYEIRPKS